MKSYLDKREKLLKARMGKALETPVNPDFRMEMDSNMAKRGKEVKLKLPNKK